MKQLTTQQQNWVDQAVPPMAPAGSQGVTTMGELINDLYALGGVVVPYTSNAAPDTADTVTHNLGRVPVGYIAIQSSKAGIVYNGGAAGAFSATATTISLKCNVASNAVTLIVI